MARVCGRICLMDFCRRRVLGNGLGWQSGWQLTYGLLFLSYDHLANTDTLLVVGALFPSFLPFCDCGKCLRASSPNHFLSLSTPRHGYPSLGKKFIAPISPSSEFDVDVRRIRLVEARRIRPWRHATFLPGRRSCCDEAYATD